MACGGAEMTKFVGTSFTRESDGADAFAGGGGGGGGGVTSVGGTGTVSGLTLTGTVTSTGNLTLGGALSVLPSNFASQTANTFLAAPNGAAGVPTFRAIVAADIPTLNQNTTGSAATLTASRAITMTGDVSWTVSFNGGAAVSAAGTIQAQAVTYAKIQAVAANSVLARAAATSGDVGAVALSASQLFGRGSTGDLAPITLGTNLSMSGTTLNATGGGGGLTNNWTATSAPTASNDNTGGYAVGSQWLWAASNISWTCMDAATGAAVWVPNSPLAFRDFGHLIIAAAGATTLFTNGASGVTFQAGGTASGIASDTTAYGKFPRIRYTTAASAGSFQNLRTAGNGSPTSRQSGIYFDCVWGHADAATVTETRSFCGVRQGGDVGNVNPSTLINIIGVGNDTGEANLQLMVNDGTGTATKTDLGANFPSNTLAADMYRLQIFAAPGASSVNWVLTRLNTGNVSSGSVSADIPALTTMLGFTLFRGNGATALACRYDLSYLVMTPMRLI